MQKAGGRPWIRGMEREKDLPSPCQRVGLRQGQSRCLPDLPPCGIILQQLVSCGRDLYSLQDMSLLTTFLAPHILPEVHR